MSNELGRGSGVRSVERAITIGGDLYEHDRAGADTATFLLDTFRSWAPIEVLLAPGNHDALLSGSTDTPSRESLQTIALDRIRPGRYQPRSRMDEASLDELAASIKAQGVMQPILVRPVDANRFEIVAGERRWLAARRAGLAEVPEPNKSRPNGIALFSLAINIADAPEPAPTIPASE